MVRLRAQLGPQVQFEHQGQNRHLKATGRSPLRDQTDGVGVWASSQEARRGECRCCCAHLPGTSRSSRGKAKCILRSQNRHITVSMPHSTRIGTSFCTGIVKSCWSHTSLANDSIWTKPSMTNVGVFARAYLSTSRMDKRSHWKWAATWTSFLKVCASYLIICVKSYMGNSRSFSNSKRASHALVGSVATSKTSRR